MTLQPLLYQGVPVRSSREWIDFLMPGQNGDWIWGTQSQTNDGSSGANGIDPLHVEFILVNLAAETSVVIPIDTHYVYRHDEGSFVGHVALSHTNQKIDPHGNLWIPAANNHLFKVPQGAQTVIQLPQIQDHPPGKPSEPNNNPVKQTPNDATQYTHEFNHDGSKLYTGTQSNWRPAIIEIDTKTDGTRIVGHVGGPQRIGFSYAYYMAIDGDWIYVCVGKQPWELCRISISTGQTDVLTTAPATGNMAFTIEPNMGIYVTIDTKLGEPDNQRQQFWCVDGAMIRYVPGEKVAEVRKKFVPRDCTPFANPVVNPPQLDDSPGMGMVRWRPHGSTGPWRDVSFPVPHPELVDIESLTILPNGDILGNAVNYQGFFRYLHSTRRPIWYGSKSGIVSRGPRLVVDGTVWIAGYPNGKLYSYNPALEWNEAAGNPFHHDNFSASKMKYASFLDYSPANGRLYCAGRREREGVGTGLGWYHIGTNRFDGTDLNLSTVSAQGLLTFDDCVIISTTPLGDQSTTDSAAVVPPSDAQLIRFTPDLVEIERQTVVQGMKNTGSLFRITNDNSIFVGLVKTPGAEMLYRYNFRLKQVLLTKSLGMPVGASWQNPATGDAYAVIGGILYAINLTTLAITKVSDAQPVATAELLVVTPAEIVVAVGPTLSVLSRAGLHATVNPTWPDLAGA